MVHKHTVYVWSDSPYTKRNGSRGDVSFINKVECFIRNTGRIDHRLLAHFIMLERDQIKMILDKNMAIMYVVQQIELKGLNYNLNLTRLK